MVALGKDTVGVGTSEDQREAERDERQCYKELSIHLFSFEIGSRVHGLRALRLE
jgi:hypothetical protein